MTWEEKFAAIRALDFDACLRMRKPGDWYVSWRVEVKDGGILKGEYGNGDSPEIAVNDHWEKITNLKPHQALVVGAYKPDRAEYRWNGYMWSRQ